ncbi:lipoprotein NlpD [Candidatus Kinetoplastibacterium desouzaii TCC079E]|uniref:Lipoprotein NlpD n=1 Tax=Candidatus Kinetoplastidibacterium desouzai TCC079E TaxID=1208919 RepID=M1LM74_9PROT|nr:peptidoglycan DD-metalloendopeptidase family protein [Candidatus Kinetoplastibacterium desouzaii]AGF46822.1 lipoprotein NlpD [Candidatus Kinetoplastibacterium desouzaii TCC079E]
MFRIIVFISFFLSLPFFLSGCVNQDKRIARIIEVSLVSSRDISFSNIYIVEYGDSLFKIAKQHGVSLDSIKNINNIVGSNIREGEVIYIPSLNYSNPIRTNRIKPIKKDSKNLDKRIVNKISWSWPYDGCILENFSVYNRGIDISGNFGDYVRAAADGTVAYSGNGVKGLGNLLIISHDDGFITAYAHNSKLLVSVGDTVKENMNIAKIGNSGTDSCKLHFEIRKNGSPIDPLIYLPLK